MLFPVTLNDPSYPKPPHFRYVLSPITSSNWVEIETSNLVDRLIVASVVHEGQTVPVRSVVKSREPFNFWWAPTVSLERLIVSSAVNFGGRWVWLTGVDHLFVTLTVDICVQHGGHKSLRRAGLSAAAETCLYHLGKQETHNLHLST